MAAALERAQAAQQFAASQLDGELSRRAGSSTSSALCERTKLG
jgi:hypothetical protein